MPPGGPPAALSFDLDNTLIDRDAAAASWWRERLLAAGVPPADLERALGALAARDARGHGPREALFAFAAEQFGLGEPATLWARFRAELSAHLRPDPRIPELLARLRLRYRVGILTDGNSALQRAKLAAAGLRAGEHFDALVISEEIGRRKPDPAAFAAVLSALGARAEHTVHVGDHPVRDVIGALRAGLGACWVGTSPWPGPGPAPERVVPHVSHLPEGSGG